VVGGVTEDKHLAYPRRCLVLTCNTRQEISDAFSCLHICHRRLPIYVNIAVTTGDNITSKLVRTSCTTSPTAGNLNKMPAGFPILHLSSLSKTYQASTHISDQLIS
jgi:hypothetical protein